MVFMKKVIFTFDGGGLYAIGPLKYLTNVSYKPDYMVGTSAGAIIALLAALPEDYSWKQCYDMLNENGANVFKCPGILWKLNPWKPKYDSDNLINAFKKVFKNYRMCDLKIPTTIILTNMLTGKPEIVNERSTRYIIDVLIDTTAAPSVFEIKTNYCDGSLSGNNPSLFAIIDRIYGYTDIKNYKVVSFNTNAEAYKSYRLNRPLNLLQLIKPVINATFSAIEETSHLVLKQLFDSEDYMRISPNVNWSADTDFGDPVILKKWPPLWQKEFELTEQKFKKIIFDR